jgi:hypothetical protein
MTAMPRIGTALALCALIAAPAHAQDQMTSRLSQEHVGDIDPGTYSAGGITFMLDAYGGKFILRFAGDPEIYVLYADRASLGGRILKYDSGQTAIRVTGWGALTLYTDAAPGGVPAERTGDSLPPSLGMISLEDMQNAAEDEAEHLASISASPRTGTHWLATRGCAPCASTRSRTRRAASTVSPYRRRRDPPLPGRSTRYELRSAPSRSCFFRAGR